MRPSSERVGWGAGGGGHQWIALEEGRCEQPDDDDDKGRDHEGKQLFQCRPPPNDAYPTPSAWLPPRLWTCPRDSTTLLTREAAPRRPRCGFREGT
jgi:hypothetical protein